MNGCNAKILKNAESYRDMSIIVHPANRNQSVDERIAAWMKVELTRGDLSASELLYSEHAVKEIFWALKMACRVYRYEPQELTAVVRVDETEVRVMRTAGLTGPNPSVSA